MSSTEVALAEKIKTEAREAHLQFASRIEEYNGECKILFGLILQEARRSHGVDMQELAEKTGYSRLTPYLWATGRTAPWFPYARREIVQRIAKMLRNAYEQPSGT